MLILWGVGGIAVGHDWEAERNGKAGKGPVSTDH